MRLVDAGVSLKLGERKPVSANLLLSCYVASGR